MTLFTPKTMLSHLRGREHIAWLETQVRSKQTIPILENHDRSGVRADMISVEIYHGLVWFLEAYPHISRVRPVWEPFVDPNDRSMLVRVRLEIESADPEDREDARNRVQESQRTLQSLDRYYSYEDAPPSIQDKHMEAFNTLVELCEQIGPETWESFVRSPLDESSGYASVSEVVEEMESELGPLLANLGERLMEKWLPHPREGGKPKLRSPGSGRL